MKTRAKMRLDSITDYGYGKELTFRAQYDDTIEEDRRFQKATPTAEAKFHIDNPSALEMFTGKIGHCFYFDISPAE